MGYIYLLGLQRKEVLFPLEIKRAKFESSVLLHPSSPRAAKHGCWSKTLVSSEASGVSGFPTGALPAPAMPAAGAPRRFLLDG